MKPAHFLHTSVFGLIFFLAGIVFFTPSAHAAFLPAVTYPAGDGAFDQLAADLDNDGDIDAAVVNNASISILLNNGNGTFAAAVNYAAVASTFKIYGADINNDNDIDLFAQSGGQLFIFPNNGNGTFGAASVHTFVGTFNTLDLEFSDFDQNGSIDFVIPSLTSDSVFVYLNNGSGTFTSSTYALAATGDPYDVEVADFNGDGFPDITAPNDTQLSVSVLLNDGDGTFAAAVNYATGKNPDYVFVADFDQDDDIDITTLNAGSSTFSVLLNDGDGTFATSTNYAVTSPYEGLIDDFNNDGYTDIASVSAGSNVVSVLLNNGDGTFATSVDYSVGVGGFAYRIRSGDLDGDGDVELVVVKAQGANVFVILDNNGDGSFVVLSPTTIAVESYNMTIADFDQDADLDLIISSRQDDNISYYQNTAWMPDPSLSTMNPSSAAAGSSGFTMTLTGSGFVASSTVYFNGTPRTTTYVNGNTLTASILTADLVTAGSYDVYVLNSTFIGGGSSTVDTFTVHAAVGGAGSGGGGLSSSGSGGSSALPPLTTTFQTNLQNLQNQGISVHSLIKIPSNSAVYYVGADGKRHAFPNDKVYFTWYENFDGVQLVNEAQMSSIPLGKNVTYKPGKKMVKFTTDNKVYVVAKGGILRWVTTEAAATELYGSSWNMQIDDISDAFYTNYTFGNNVGGLSDFNPTTVQASVMQPSDSLEM